jgi:hypothetical protein
MHIHICIYINVYVSDRLGFLSGGPEPTVAAHPAAGQLLQHIQLQPLFTYIYSSMRTHTHTCLCLLRATFHLGAQLFDVICAVRKLFFQILKLVHIYKHL